MITDENVFETGFFSARLKIHVHSKWISITRKGGVVVSKNTASGLSTITEDLVHKQLNPHRHEYKLSKLSGIQVHPLTNTPT
ncbi:hypothetical protein HanXRQr2_Chr11g0471611 [Helianthus annuus]|uniref:Uncharacterized protein n=1 Tax=Helianthus annuus TaxID=4232 RepID=A0A9K3MYE5_HELAN|nr:hypothetical protein HanXRQr2_Chr11g0471611 [Helianthus annuus]